MKTRKLTVTALFAAVAVAVNAAESLLPAVAFLPPGAKLGLSNVVTMFCSAVMGLPGALGVAVTKSLFVLATRGFTAFLMSAAGGIFSTCVCFLLLRYTKKHVGYLGIGILGAVTHNCAQTAVSALLAGKAILYYLPFLAAASAITGAVSGFVLGFLQKYFPIHIIGKDIKNGT